MKNTKSTLIQKKIGNKKNNKINIEEKKVEIVKTFKVKEPTYLLEFLFSKITNDSKNNIKHLLSNKQVLIDGVCTTQFNFMLAKDDVVQISKNPILKSKEIKIKLDIIYEDNNYIVINKPAGLLSIESDKETTNTAYRLVMEHVRSKDKNARVYITHRIDKETSGVLLFTKNEKLRDKLQHNWQKIVKTRKYIAICEGVFTKKNDTIKSYLKSNVNNLMYSSNDKSGQLSITHYKVIKENKKYSMLEVLIDTGRKNQIRVHMSDLNHKILGDKKYNSKLDPLSRLALHAYVLEFIDPISGEKMTFKAKIPTTFQTLF